MGAFSITVVLIIGIAIGYYLGTNHSFATSLTSGNSASQLGNGTNNNTVRQSTLQSTLQSASQIQSTCQSNIQSQLNIVETRFPSGSQFNIENTSVFYGNTTYDAINTWIGNWTSYYNSNGALVTGGCIDGGDYICSDLNSLNGSTAYVKAVGVALQVQINYNDAGAIANHADVFPLLCDGNGNLMPSSQSWLHNLERNIM